jgi:hypothetical protein
VQTKRSRDSNSTNNLKDPSMIGYIATNWAKLLPLLMLFRCSRQLPISPAFTNIMGAAFVVKLWLQM